MNAVIVFIWCLYILSLPHAYANRSETPADLILIHIVSNWLKVDNFAVRFMLYAMVPKPCYVYCDTVQLITVTVIFMPAPSASSR